MAVTDSIKNFGLLCQQVTAEPSLRIKSEILSGFISRFAGDLELLVKLLLPKYTSRIYYMQEKQLFRVLSTVLNVNEDELRNTWNRNGCIAETAQKYFKPTAAVDKDGWCAMDLATFDGHLDKMAAASSEPQRVQVIADFFRGACPNAVYLFFREIKMDLRLGAGLRVVLNALHPSAYELFQHCADVREVVRRVQAGETQSQQQHVTVLSDTVEDTDDTSTTGAVVQGHDRGSEAPAKTTTSPARGVRAGRVEARIQFGIPLAPMLAAPAKGIDEVLAKCPNGAFSEVKYDGERIQIHKQGKTLHFFARSLKPMRPDKYAGLENYLLEAIQAENCILDGEILMVDIRTSVPLPFGTLGKHKKTQFASACPCVFLFDILYRDGETLLQEPMERRREIMKASVKMLRNRVMFSELCLVTGDVAKRRAILQQHMNRAIAEGLEGLVVKDLKSVYEPRARHWLKIKKDYLDGLADSADLLVLGAWYGSGNKGGQLSTFLMGCVDASVPAGQPGRFKTVCKVGNGLDDMAITILTKKYKGTMSPATLSGASWLDCQTLHVPDVIVKDPMQADVMEIIGAEFSVTKHHTAGVSIRFPRILRIRSDKTVDTATTNQEILALYRISKERVTSAGLGEALPLEDDYVRLEEGLDREESNTEPPPPATAASTTSVQAVAPSAVSAISAPSPAASSLLRYVPHGDATRPDRPTTECLMLCHSSAVGGQWSARGFMGSVTRVYGPAAEKAYSQSVGKRQLGDVIVTEVGDASRPGRVFVATMMAQAPAVRGAVPAVDTAALIKCLVKCAGFAVKNGASLHLVKPPEETGVQWAQVHDALLSESRRADLLIIVYGAAPANWQQASAPPPPPPPSTTTPSAAAAAPEQACSTTAPAFAHASHTDKATRKRPREDESAEIESPLSATPAPRLRTSLPASWWLLLKSVRAFLVVSTPSEEEALRGAIAMLGGTVVNAGPGTPPLPVLIAEGCTHVVVGAESQSQTVLAATETALSSGGSTAMTGSPSVRLVTGEWVLDCLEDGVLYTEGIYHPRCRRVLDGCRLVLGDIREDPRGLQRLARLMGAVIHPQWKTIGRRTTHCISSTWGEMAMGVFEIGGRVVSPQWIVDCAVAQTAVPVQPYLLPRDQQPGYRPQKSGGARGNVLEGVLCGLRLHVCPGSFTPAMKAALEAAIEQMGGHVEQSKPEEAQYCVMSTSEFKASTNTLSPALRYRCVSAQWLFSTARHKALQDPSPFLLTHNSSLKLGERRPSQLDLSAAAVDEELGETGGEDIAEGSDDDDALSSSTETYVSDANGEEP